MGNRIETVDQTIREGMQHRGIVFSRRQRREIVRYQEQLLDDARFAVIGFGTAGRVASSAVRDARAEGIQVGLLRPITLAPFPEKRLVEIAEQVERILVVEMNSGMMLDDVLKIVKGRVPVEFYGRMGGVTPLPDEILEEIQRISKNTEDVSGDPRDEWMIRLEAKLTGEK